MYCEPNHYFYEKNGITKVHKYLLKSKETNGEEEAWNFSNQERIPLTQSIFDMPLTSSKTFLNRLLYDDLWQKVSTVNYHSKGGSRCFELLIKQVKLEASIEYLSLLNTTYASVIQQANLIESPLPQISIESSPVSLVIQAMFNHYIWCTVWSSLRNYNMIVRIQLQCICISK